MASLDALLNNILASPYDGGGVSKEYQSSPLQQLRATVSASSNTADLTNYMKQSALAAAGSIGGEDQDDAVVYGVL
jgi:hypothetical protein